jgi:hypothetical protein
MRRRCVATTLCRTDLRHSSTFTLAITLAGNQSKAIALSINREVFATSKRRRDWIGDALCTLDVPDAAAMAVIRVRVAVVFPCLFTQRFGDDDDDAQWAWGTSSAPPDISWIERTVKSNHESRHYISECAEHFGS